MTEPGTPRDAVEAQGIAPSGPTAPTDEEWIDAFRAAVAVQRQIFSDHHGIAARTEYEGIGEGGDRTLVIDRLCEDAIFAELERIHERGARVHRDLGGARHGQLRQPGAPLRVVIDPIDGSLNARRTIPCHSVSIAVAGGDSMADVTLGYVYEFGAGEEFIATLGGGATLDGEPISTPGGDGIEVVAMEATKPERVRAAAESLSGAAYRLRSPGTIAVSLCYVAGGRFDGMITTRNCRSVDAAAAQLVAREAGAALEFAGFELSEAPLDLSARYDVAAARTPADLAVLRTAQDAVD